jgi:hypothetical protein
MKSLIVLCNTFIYLIYRILFFICLAITFLVISILERWPFLVAGLAIGTVFCFAKGRFS